MDQSGKECNLCGANTVFLKIKRHETETWISVRTCVKSDDSRGSKAVRSVNVSDDSRLDGVFHQGGCFVEAELLHEPRPVRAFVRCARARVNSGSHPAPRAIGLHRCRNARCECRGFRLRAMSGVGAECARGDLPW